jgi:hypothetical protein
VFIRLLVAHAVGPTLVATAAYRPMLTCDAAFRVAEEPQVVGLARQACVASSAALATRHSATHVTGCGSSTLPLYRDAAGATLKLCASARSSMSRGPTRLQPSSCLTPVDKRKLTSLQSVSAVQPHRLSSPSWRGRRAEQCVPDSVLAGYCTQHGTAAEHTRHAPAPED